MNGLSCSPGQLAHARTFIEQYCAHREIGDGSIQMAAGDLVRLVAWYGALRYIAGYERIGGTLDQPGELVRVATGGASTRRIGGRNGDGESDSPER